MVLKRKLPTQIAQEEKDKEAREITPSSAAEENKTIEDTTGGDEPWVFSGSENEKKEPETAKEEPAPWSAESMAANTPKETQPTEEKPAAAPSSSGDYPWAINTSNGQDSWKIDSSTPSTPELSSADDGAKPPLAPTNDIYAGVGQDKKEESKPTGGVPPWASAGGGGAGGGKTPPILPDTAGGKSGGGLVKSIVMLVIVGAVFVGGYLALFKKRDEVAEVTARWTGTLNEVSQEIESVGEGDPEPEDIISFSLGSGKKPEKKETSETAESAEETVEETVADAPKQDAEQKTAKKEPATKVDFVDVEKEKADDPIVADEKTEMPKDLSLFASLQAAIMKEKEEKRTQEMAKVSKDDPEVDPETLSEEEKMQIGQKLKKQTNERMEDYIKTLTQIKNPALKPKPGEFFEDPEKYKERADSYRMGKSLGASQEKSASYNSNPKNLPVIPEPTVPVKPGVRTLADFEDQIFEIPRDKVRMPRHMKPKMGAAGFPSLEILSLVPHKGIIAFARGKEGVLMIGDSIEGWELTAVRAEYAEFHNGKRKHIVSIDVIR